MDDFDISVVKDFLEGNYRAFEQHCSERGVSAEEIVEKLEELSQ